VTNANEGGIFVDQVITTADYLANLFPRLGPKEIQAGTAAYAGLGLSKIQQASLMIGEGKSFYSPVLLFPLCASYFVLKHS